MNRHPGSLPERGSELPGTLANTPKHRPGFNAVEWPSSPISEPCFGRRDAKGWPVYAAAACASCRARRTMKSAKRAVGSKPRTASAFATKFDVELTS